MGRRKQGNMIKAIAMRLPQSILFLLAAACGSDDDAEPSPSSGGMSGGGGNGSGGTPPGEVSCSGLSKDAAGKVLLEANALNNYAYASTLEIEVTPVAAQSELTFDWSALTKDFQGHTIDPEADIDMVSLLMWRLTLSEFQAKLGKDGFESGDPVIASMIKTQNTRTSVGLFEFQTLTGEPLEPELLLAYLDPEVYDPAEHSYTIVAASGEMAGQGSRMLGSRAAESRVRTTPRS